jgi:RNA polymerase sigma-70 factor (ECF subfamily)
MGYGGGIIAQSRARSAVATSAGSGAGPLRPQSGVRLREVTSIDANLAMDRYAAGDDAAFARVYDAVAPRVYAYLYRQTRDASRAEDLVQATLLQIHRARGTFISGSRVLPWAFAIARRLLIDELRKSKRDVAAGAVTVDETLPSDAHSVSDSVEAEELERAIQRELALLPANQRTAFELVRLEGLSHAEAAETMGVTVNSVKLRVHRVYSALKRLLPDG